MKLLPSIKWNFFNSYLNIFLLYRFKLHIVNFSLSDIYEIHYLREFIEFYINRLKQEHGKDIKYKILIKPQTTVCILYLVNSTNYKSYINLKINPLINWNSKIVNLILN